MFNLSAQTRSWQPAFILQLVYAFVTRKLWDPATVLVTVKGKTGPANMAETIKAIFEDGKIITLGEGKKVTAGEILAKAEAFDAKNAKAKFPVIVEGRHRVVALWLVSEFFGISIEPECNEIAPEQAERFAVEGNMTNEMYARLLSSEKLAGVVRLVKTNVYTKQSEVNAKRGQQQTLWWRAQAVLALEAAGKEVDLEKIGGLKWQEAKDVANGKLEVEAALAARAGNAKKVLPGDKIRELATICKNYDAEGTALMARLINAIIDNSETSARQAIIEFYTKK